MFKLATFLIGVFLLFELPAYEEDLDSLKCPYGCGQRYLDYDIPKVQKLINQLLQDIRFHD